MKKILNLAMAACAVMAVVSCNPDTPAVYAAPEMEWAANPDFSAVELAPSMNVNIKVRAEAGIESFVVKVASGTLSPVISALTSDNSSDMDLIGDTQLISSLDALTGGLMPVGTKLYGKSEIDFDLSALVPLILELSPTKGSDHVFTLVVTDRAGKSLRRSLVFHYSGISSVSVSDADLWLNTASVEVTCAEGVTAPAVYCGIKGGTFYEVAADAGGRYIIAPEYVNLVNPGGLEVLSAKPGTGIYAGNTYVVELREGDEVLASCEYEAPEGDAIPNGDMKGWSFRNWIDDSGKSWKITFPNEEGESFWDSGNNAFLEQYGEDGLATLLTPLCSKGDEEGTALLSARKVLGFVFAPGNMYTGDFDYSGFSGTAHFGKKYGWTARPSALRVRYKADVGIVDEAGSHDPEKNEWVGRQDVARIYAAVVDWTRQHDVVSGMVKPSGMWDPCLQNSVDEGAVIGYASLEITESTDGYVTEDIAFVWYDAEARPAGDNYSVLISCSTSNRGDYLTGCSTNTLCVGGFEWVY